MGTTVDAVPWKSVNGTRGISAAVTLDGVYRSINTDIIKGLKRRCNENGVIQHLGKLGTIMANADSETRQFIYEYLQMLQGKKEE